MFGSFLFAFTLIYHSTFRMNRKIPIGAEEILLRDKKFYLAVEFSLLREADFTYLHRFRKCLPVVRGGLTILPLSA